MGFSFNAIAGVQPSTGLAALQGNKIHTVTFDGVESVDVVSKNNGNTYKLLRIKFSNSEGSYTQTYFEPTAADDQPSITKTANGDIVNPSSNLQMMATFKQLLTLANPVLVDKIDKGEVNDIATWDGFRTTMVAATKDFIGKTCQIKLIKNNKGEGIMPKSVLNFSRDNHLYTSTTVIGSALVWTKKEKERIDREASAQPTPVAAPANPFTVADKDSVEDDPFGGGNGLDLAGMKF